MLCLGIDTSNYATSMAVFDSEKNALCCDEKKFLPVKKGGLGLRQSDALFHHTAALPGILEKINQTVPVKNIGCVGVSVRPRPVQGSYMPCFTAGHTFASAISLSLDVPMFCFSHQEGHIAAAVFAAGNPKLKNSDNLVFHISGGTTELLLCNGTRVVKCVGATTDLFAGQAVDRLGVKLGYDFPAGKYVTELALHCDEKINPAVSVKGTSCSLSGLQNKCEKLLADGKDAEYAAKFCLISIAKTIKLMVNAARKEYGNLPLLCAGGVMSSDVIKQWLCDNLRDVYFVDGKFASDNAIGTAVLASEEVR